MLPVSLPLLVAFGLIGLNPIKPDAKAIDRSIAAISQRDGKVKVLSRKDGLPFAVDVYLGLKATDKDLDLLAPFPEVRCLYLLESSLTAKGTEVVARLPGLEELHLTYTDVGDAVIKPLSAATGLRVSKVT